MHVLYVEVVGVAVTFSLATGALFLLASSLTEKDGTPLSFPTTVDDLRSLSGHLQRLQDSHPYHLLALFSAAYLYKQTFAIPGSVFMNVLAGALYGVWQGLPLVCLLTATGASFCFLLSRVFGRRLVHSLLGHRITALQNKLSGDHQSLFVVLVSVRLFPMAPNWLLNLASPQLGVPLPLFFLSVLLGLIPYNYLCVQAGLILAELQLAHILDTWSTIVLVGGTAVLLTVGALMHKLRTREKS